MESELGRARGRIAATNPADLGAAVDTLLDALRCFPEVLAAGEPEERKAVVRAFLQEIRIEKTTRQAA